MNAQTVAQLVKKARDGATGSTMNIGELLRLCMRLGSVLSNSELEDWARKEAGGYTDDDKLPDYRIIPAEARGTFHGPFGSGIKNAHIPQKSIDKQHREALFNIRLTEPVSQLELYASAKNGDAMMSKPWPGDAIAYYQQKIYTNDMVLGSAWNPVNAQVFGGVVDTIRTRVLDFMIQIEKELDADLDQPDVNVHLTPQNVTNIFHNAIYGDSVAFSNTGTSNITNVTIQQGNLNQLNSYLSQIGLDKIDLAELESALKSDPSKPSKELGPKVASWLSKMTIKSLKGGLSVGKDVAAALIAQSLMKYYGISDR